MIRRFLRWALRRPRRDFLYNDGAYDVYVTGTGQVLRGVHDPALCAGRPCVVHAPSDHVMRAFPTHWRHGGAFDIKPPHMERICPHGIGHPDPDDVAYLRSIGEDVSVHGCDGCCSEVPLQELAG